MGLRFEWNPGKSSRNLHKHDVSFEEATTVFADPLSLIISDPLHSTDEDRFIIMGMSANKRLLVVVHVDIDDSIRIISARLATRHERKDYEEESIL